jgi:hypothetical protein
MTMTTVSSGLLALKVRQDQPAHRAPLALRDLKARQVRRDPQARQPEISIF